MRGAIDVDSSPGQTIFSVALPMAVHTQAVSRLALRGRVALLEDRPRSRAALRNQLEPAGVVVVDDVDHADVVLVDQGHAKGTGGALATALVAAGKKVGLLRRLDGSHLEETGAAFVLPSPVREHALHQQLAQLLHERPLAPVHLKPSYRQFEARVLVAEDNPVNQRVVMGLLRKLGCEVELASDGGAAIEAFARGGFDLVFMDCQMPDVDGFEATRRIRATQHAPVPIVALTAGVMEGDRERCLAAGMDDFLSKPVRLEDLERTLARHLQPLPVAATG